MKFKKKKKKGFFIFNIKDRLRKAGILTPASSIRPSIIKFSIFLSILGTISLVILSILKILPVSTSLFYIVLLWSIGLVLINLILWVVLSFYLDIIIFKRSKEIEIVLADFLQIASANIRSGMSIEKALWYAVRPNFGVLAKEIDVVAKEVMSGKDLVVALREFNERYDSKTLSRSINLLIEGILSGGETGDLLDKIANNIQETDLMKKDMAANVTSYSIFITFASLVAAPLLFALSGQLLQIVTSIFSKIHISSDMSSNFPISLGGVGLSANDYTIFAVVTLVISSSFSAFIIATIKKGNAKYGVKSLPVFIITAVTIFLILSKIMGYFFSSIF